MKDLHVLWNSIAIIWRKRIGKNFFAWRLAKILYENGIEPLTEISIADFLKANSYTPQWFEDDYFDYDYLFKDYVDFIKNVNDGSTVLISDYFSDGILRKYQSSTNKDFWFWEFSDAEKRELIEKFKTLDGYRTRLSLQLFWDYIKNKNNDPFVLSSKLLNAMKPGKYLPIVWCVNTDTRFITELIDFVLEGFYIISLENSDLYREDPWNEHISEIELWFSQIKTWLIVDVKWPEYWEVVDWVKRMSKDQFDEKIYAFVPHLLSFRWYAKVDLDKIADIKNRLKDGTYNFFELQDRLNKDFVNYKNNNDEESLEYLLDSYDKYCEIRNFIMNEIDDILSKYY